MFCTTCGNQFTPGDQFCARCGGGGPVSAATLAAAAPQDTTFCTTCGLVMPASADFCPHCAAGRDPRVAAPGGSFNSGGAWSAAPYGAAPGYAAPRGPMPGYGEPPWSGGMPIAAGGAWTASGSAPGTRRVAAPGPRIGAYALDALIGFGIFVVAALLLGWISDSLGGWLGFLGATGYWIWGNVRGQTLGKRATKVRVVSEATGATPSTQTAVLRVAMMLLCIFIPFWIGYFWFLWDPKRQTLYDKMAGTLVVPADP